MHLYVYRMTVQSLLNKTRSINVDDRNSFHKMILKACNSDRASAKALYRIRTTKNDITIFIQSLITPDESIMREYGFDYITTLDMETFYNNIQKNDIIHFNTMVFPARKTDNSSKYLKTQEERMNWFSNQMEKHGLQLERCEELSNDFIHFKKSSTLTKIKSSTIEGFCRVTDKEAFYDLLLNGLGKCKNYGLGLFMVQ